MHQYLIPVDSCAFTYESIIACINNAFGIFCANNPVDATVEPLIATSDDKCYIIVNAPKINAQRLDKFPGTLTYYVATSKGKIIKEN